MPPLLFSFLQSHCFGSVTLITHITFERSLNAFAVFLNVLDNIFNFLCEIFNLTVCNYFMYFVGNVVCNDSHHICCKCIHMYIVIQQTNIQQPKNLHSCRVHRTQEIRTMDVRNSSIYKSATVKSLLASNNDKRKCHSKTDFNRKLLQLL